MDSRPDEVLAAREARGARSEQDVSPKRIAVFTAVVVTLAWVWLGLAWAVVAAVFVVPPWLIVTIQARVSHYRRITPEQRAAISKVRLWQDPMAGYAALVIALIIAMSCGAAVAEQRGASERAIRLVMSAGLLLLGYFAGPLRRRAAAGRRLSGRSVKRG